MCPRGLRLIIAVWFVLQCWSHAPAASPVHEDDPLLAGIKASGKGTIVNVPVVSFQYLLMDAMGSRRLQFQSDIFGTVGSPPVYTSYISRRGERIELESAELDPRDSTGRAMWMPIAQIGEAVLLKVTCEEFPGDRKTVVTYNAAVRGIAEVDGSSQQLLASEAPPYYNTFPVDAAKHGFRNSSYANTPGLSGIAFASAACDSPTSAGIGLPYSEAPFNSMLLDSTVTARIAAVGEPSREWSGEFTAQSAGSSTAYYLGWGFASSPPAASLYFNGSPPAGDVVLEMTLLHGSSVFQIAAYEFQMRPDSFFNPLNGPPFVGPTNAIKDAQVANGVPAHYVDAVPNSLQLLEAVDEYLSGRAVLATHLATLCDVNRDGIIDKDDRTALIIELGLQGAVAY